MSIGLLHEDLRQDFQKALSYFFLESRNVEGQLVKRRRQGWTKARGEHGVQHGGHFVFDALLDGTGQHANTGKDRRIDDDFFLAAVHFLGRRETVFDVAQHIFQIRLNLRTSGHGEETDGNVGVGGIFAL